MRRLRILSEERGFVLATSMAVLLIILTLGLVALQTVDFQTKSSGQETAGEAAFNLAESALDAETSQLGTQWPSTSGSAWNAACNQSTSPTTGCPGTSLTSSFSSTYAGSQFKNPQWQLEVIDNTWNPNTDYYSDTLATSAPHYDWDNGQPDNKLWVRAQATIAGQTRVVVAEVVRQPHVISLPRNVITAGGVFTSDNGNKIIINAADSVQNSGLTGEVALRCGTATPPTPVVYGSSCAGWDESHGQLSPPTYNAGYTDATPGYQTLQSDQLTALENSGTVYNGACPPAGAAGVVVVENPPGGSCYYNANTTWNSDAAPGMLIFLNGTVEFDGTLNFYGIIYMADQNGQPGPCTTSALQQDEAKNGGPVFTVHGTGTLYGALFVGNCGVVDAGSSAFNIQFDSNAFKGAVAFATPALAKNTFQIVAHP